MSREHIAFNIFAMPFPPLNISLYSTECLQYCINFIYAVIVCILHQVLSLEWESATLHNRLLSFKNKPKSSSYKAPYTFSEVKHNCEDDTFDTILTKLGWPLRVTQDCIISELKCNLMCSSLTESLLALWMLESWFCNFRMVTMPQFRELPNNIHKFCHRYDLTQWFSHQHLENLLIWDLLATYIPRICSTLDYDAADNAFVGLKAPVFGSLFLSPNHV